jgi:bifunctional non-homologous end joining protein LigD
VWDNGHYQVLGATATDALKRGRLHLVLTGKKLKGEWALVRLRSTGDNDEKNWLLMKTGGDASPISPSAKERSVLTGRTLKQVAEGKNAELDEYSP